MGNWPDVAVLIPTYHRALIVKRTVELLRANLRYSGRVHILVGCDGTDSTPSLLSHEPDGDVDVLSAPSGSLGANLNRLMRVCGADLMLAMDDDHHLVAPLSLDRHVTKLMLDETAGWIHLLMEARGDERNDPYRFTATLDAGVIGGTAHYWRVDWHSNEPYIVSFRPHLFHRRWLDVYGWMPEGLRTGQTEWTYAQQCRARGLEGSAPAVLVPLSAHDANTWHHVGESWNKRGL